MHVIIGVSPHYGSPKQKVPAGQRNTFVGADHKTLSGLIKTAACLIHTLTVVTAVVAAPNALTVATAFAIHTQQQSIFFVIPQVNRGGAGIDDGL